jgi:hypothetical protein
VTCKINAVVNANGVPVHVAFMLREDADGQSEASKHDGNICNMRDRGKCPPRAAGMGSTSLIYKVVDNAVQCEPVFAMDSRKTGKIQANSVKFGHWLGIFNAFSEPKTVP